MSNPGTVHIRSNSSNPNNFRFGNEPFSVRTRIVEEATATDSRARRAADQDALAILLRHPPGDELCFGVSTCSIDHEAVAAGLLENVEEKISIVRAGP